MNAIQEWIGLGLAVACVAVADARLIAVCKAAQTEQKSKDRARVAISHELPPMNGAKLSVTAVEVSYGPGESSPAHSHPCPVIGYVLEGAIRSQVKGEPEAVYKAGATFYEAPNGVHQVSANGSDKEPAKLLAYFVCDRQGPLSVAAPGN
jgi:quercetin dioxygenase-like cupin family protein